jgi:peptide/nickel transport system permease protein
MSLVRFRDGKSFDGLALVILALAVNLLGDWLRDAINPKLR